MGVLGLFSFLKGANWGLFPLDSSTLARLESGGFREHKEHSGQESSLLPGLIGSSLSTSARSA